MTLLLFFANAITDVRLQAHKIDTPDLTTQPHLSSILDDTFYLLKLVLSRLLSCGSLSTLKNMRRKIAEVIEKDYTDVIRRKMDNVHSLAGGGDRTERERREKDQREAFSVSFFTPFLFVSSC